MVTVKSKTAKAAAKSDEEGILALCKGFKSCEAAGVLLSQVCACCSRCSNQIMWRVELCAGCQGCSTGYAFYHVQAADKAATDDEILEVGHRVSNCLRAAGLSVQWNEDAHDTILVKDLTDPERRYIYNKMGPENRKFAKWAREMADQLGPVSGGEVHHDCDCMEYTCFCGKVKDLAEAQRAAYGSPSEDSTDNSESEWTDCSESELADMMKHACDCSDASCDCASGATQGQIVPKDVFL